MRKRIVALSVILASTMFLGACSSSNEKEREASDKEIKTEESVDSKKDKDGKDEDTEKDVDNSEEKKEDVAKDSMSYAEFEAMEESPAEDFYVYEGSDGVVAVKYIGNDKYVSVPAEIDGKKITKLGTSTDFYMATSSEKSLKGLKLPDTITCIEKNALLGNSQLEYLILNENLENIGEMAFGDCRSLETLVLPEGLLRIEDGAFYNTALKELTIPKSVIFIGNGTFEYTENLCDLYIENGNCEMEENVFDLNTRNSKVTVHAESGSKVEEYVKLMIEDGFEEVIGFEAK